MDRAFDCKTCVVDRNRLIISAPSLVIVEHPRDKPLESLSKLK